MNNPYQQGANEGRYAEEQQYSTYGQPRRKNILGIVGFVLSLTCLLSPIGLIVSLIALLKRPRGFAIAGTIVGLVLSSVLLLAGGGVWAVLKFGKAGAAIGVIAGQSTVLEPQVDAYITETGSMPSSLDDVHLPASAKIDPWGTPYRFNADTPSSGNWTITSAGPDQQFGSADDIDNITEFDDPDGSIIEDWMANAQQNPAIWPGWRDMISITSEIQTWKAENAERSAVAGASDTPLPPVNPAEPEDTPDAPATP